MYGNRKCGAEGKGGRIICRYMMDIDREGELNEEVHDREREMKREDRGNVGRRNIFIGKWEEGDVRQRGEVVGELSEKGEYMRGGKVRGGVRRGAPRRTIGL